MTKSLDPRRNAYRDDLAAIELEGKVQADRFIEGEKRRVNEGVAPVRHLPGHDQPLDTEALFGEEFTLYDFREGWAWGQLSNDGYVGYLPVAALGLPGTASTHRVTALRTYIFPEPNIKRPPLHLVTMNARLVVEKIEDGFAALTGGGFVPACHISESGEHAPDFVSVAEQYRGAPYFWGGRTSIGIDCSGLVQMALEAAGHACPRDTDMQMAEFGAPVSMERMIRRGDLVFWQGHVGIMQDATNLLHANAHHMMCESEPLQEAVSRISTNGGGNILDIRRLLE